MEISRRAFIQGTIIGGAAVSAFGFDVTPAYAQAKTLKISRTTETRSTCPYCSVSCGVIIHTLGDRAKNAVPQVVHVEGDPDHPINRGTLCPKGASLQQDILNERRLLKPGDYFGEVALALDVPRTATVRAVTPATVASCDRATFDELVRPLFSD